MKIEINIIWILLIIVFAVIGGYFWGIILQNTKRNEKETSGKEENKDKNGDNHQHKDRGWRKENAEKHISQGISILSPVSGKVEIFQEENQCGVMVWPEEDKVFAPVSGKIIKLYPMGCAFILRMVDQREILLQVGNHTDEVYSMCFHPRIIQNEIVKAGKLLLVFDRECLTEAGEEVTVRISLQETAGAEEIFYTQKKQVDVGDELIRIIK